MKLLPFSVIAVSFESEIMCWDDYTCRGVKWHWRLRGMVVLHLAGHGQLSGLSEHCSEPLQNLLRLQEKQFWQEQTFLKDRNLIWKDLIRILLCLNLSIVKVLLNFKRRYLNVSFCQWIMFSPGLNKHTVPTHSAKSWVLKSFCEKKNVHC